MKEILVYVKWQHRISGDSLPILLMYNVLGNRLKAMDDGISSRVMVICISMLIVTFSTLSLHNKEIKKAEKLFPIKTPHKYLGMLIYFLMTFIVGIFLTYLCTNPTVYYIIFAILFVIMLKKGRFNKENYEKLDLRKLIRRR